MSSLIAQLVKNPPAMWETWVLCQGWKDPLEKETATHSGICLENSMDCIVHGVEKSWTQPLSLSLQIQSLKTEN